VTRRAYPQTQNAGIRNQLNAGRRRDAFGQDPACGGRCREQLAVMSGMVRFGRDNRASGDIGEYDMCHHAGTQLGAPQVNPIVMLRPSASSPPTEVTTLACEQPLDHLVQDSSSGYDRTGKVRTLFGASAGKAPI